MNALKMRHCALKWEVLLFWKTQLFSPLPSRKEYPTNDTLCTSLFCGAIASIICVIASLWNFTLPVQGIALAHNCLAYYLQHMDNYYAVNINFVALC